MTAFVLELGLTLLAIGVVTMASTRNTSLTESVVML